MRAHNIIQAYLEEGAARPGLWRVQLPMDGEVAVTSTACPACFISPRTTYALEYYVHSST